MKNKNTSIGFFNDFAITNNSQHPIAKLFSDAMQECEKLPASEQQTNTVIAINKCMEAVEEQLRLHEIIMAPFTSFDNEADIEGAISDYLSDVHVVDSISLASRLIEQFNIYNKPPTHDKG